MVSRGGDLIIDLDDALVKQRPNCMSGFGLTDLRENRLQSQIQHRLTELEGYYYRQPFASHHFVPHLHEYASSILFCLVISHLIISSFDSISNICTKSFEAFNNNMEIIDDTRGTAVGFF